MRYHIFLVIICVLFTASSIAQVSHEQSVFTNGGAVKKNGNITSISTVGEMAVGSFKYFNVYEGQFGFLLTETGTNVSVPEDEIGNDFITIFPNPFTSSSTISYELNNVSNVTIEILDLNGKVINSMVNKMQSPGKYQAQINTEENRLSGGLYLVRLTFDNSYYLRKIAIIR